MTTNKMNVETKERELIMTRMFDAPRELVFETYSDCKHLMQWWGPREWPLSVCNMDFREGGIWFYCMKGPKGELACGKAVYQEIQKPEKIIYKDYFADENGNVNEDLSSGLMTIEFAEYDGKTKLTGRAEYPKPSDLEKVLEMGMIEGMTETLDRLEEHLEKVSTTVNAKGKSS